MPQVEYKTIPEYQANEELKPIEYAPTVDEVTGQKNWASIKYWEQEEARRRQQQKTTIPEKVVVTSVKGKEVQASVYRTKEYQEQLQREQENPVMWQPSREEQKRLEEKAQITATYPEGGPVTKPIADPLIAASEYGYKTAGINTRSENPFIRAGQGVAAGFIAIPETIGSSLVGVEYFLRNVKEPKTTVDATAIVAKQTLGGSFEALKADPIFVISSIAGPALILGAAGKGATKLSGKIRSVGTKNIPIEDIGYSTERGFPVSPPQSTKTITASFRRSTLIPDPVRMSLGGKAPYVPKAARLPTDPATAKIMWTAWEQSPTKDASGRFILGKGASEIPGMYGAPVAESYFAKVGGQMPNILGIDFRLLKKPSLIHTEVQGFETVPAGIRSRGMSAVSKYIQESPGGKAHFPLMKAEYEAVLGQGNVLEIKPTRYSTKVGGIGKKRWFGTTLPIYETVATGEKIPVQGALPKGIPVVDYSSYRGSGPLVNLAYSPLSSSAIRKPVTLPLTTLKSSKITRELTSSKVITKPSITTGPRTSKITKPYSPPVTPPYTPTYTPPEITRITRITPPYTPPYSPPGSTRYTPPYTPPIVPPITIIPQFGPGFGSRKRLSGSWFRKMSKVNPTPTLKTIFGTAAIKPRKTTGKAKKPIKSRVATKKKKARK